MPYRQIGSLAGRGLLPHQFAVALRSVAARGGRWYLAGDSEIKVFDSFNRDGVLHRWSTARPGHAVAVDGAGNVWVGEVGQVEIFSAGGALVDTWRDAERLAFVTSIGFSGTDVFLADARARWIRRYHRDGRFLGNIGDRHRKGGFHIPNGVVDFAVDGDGILHVANPGMHRVERYRATGELLGHFGRFDGRDPEGFPGCCNPTNLTLGPEGRIVVTEKGEPRVKIYDATGRLLVVVADSEAFDPGAKNMDVAVDEAGRIAVVDPAACRVSVFQQETVTRQEPAVHDEPVLEGEVA